MYYHYTNLTFCESVRVGGQWKSFDPMKKLLLLWIAGVRHYSKEPTDTVSNDISLKLKKAINKCS